MALKKMGDVMGDCFLSTSINTAVLRADFSSKPTNQPTLPTNQPTNQPYHHHLKVVGLGRKIHTWPLPPLQPIEYLGLTKVTR